MKNYCTLQECFEMQGSVFPFEVEMDFENKKIRIVFVERYYGTALGWKPKKHKKNYQDVIDKVIHYDMAFAGLRMYRPSKLLKFNEDMENLLK